MIYIYIYPLAKFGDVMPCSTKDTPKNATCPDIYPCSFTNVRFLNKD